jgi:predicted ATP-dependent endonuclease of OLD family
MPRLVTLKGPPVRVAQTRRAQQLKAGMIHSISINGYRGFSRFEMADLGCVNLLVGKNNSGKTSVLEAMYLLASGGDPSALWRVLFRRGERLDIESVGRQPPEIELDISHLFCGHELKPGSTIYLATKNGAPDRAITYKLVETRAQHETGDLLESDQRDRGVDSISPRLMLNISGMPKPMVGALPLTRNGGLRSDVLDTSRRPRRGRDSGHKAAQYVTTESLSVRELTSMWNDIVLTESEDLVLTALRFLEPKIERIAAVSMSDYYYGGGARGGFKVKLRDMPQPVPIGSLGDGTWRMLAVAIAIIRSKGGVLLIDEIDTGLHYSVMSDMWRLVASTSSLFDVQVFATTHSYDCIYSLATICQRHPNESGGISIQRIEQDKRQAIRYTEAEIKIAADRNIEIR